jgi:hypothetical protein
MIEERQHGDTLEHRHEGYDYWHPASRVHNESTPEELPVGHILAKVAPDEPRGLQVQPFDWAAWDDTCEAKGICQGFASIKVPSKEDCLIRLTDNPMDFLFSGFQPIVYDQELHHRNVSRDLIGLADAYWQCPHCRQLQKPIQWVQGARLENYSVKVRGSRTVIWAQVSSGQWFVLVTHGTLQGVAMGIAQGTVYAVGNKPPLQLPDETAIILARRMWHRLTRGYWSDRKTEE